MTTKTKKHPKEKRVLIRVLESTRARLRTRAFREGNKDMMILVDELSRQKKGVPIVGTVN
jgi:hypothetical protein